MTGRTEEPPTGQRESVGDRLTAVFGARCRADVSLAPMTTFRLAALQTGFSTARTPTT